MLPHKILNINLINFIKPPNLTQISENETQSKFQFKSFATFHVKKSKQKIEQKLSKIFKDHVKLHETICHVIFLRKIYNYIIYMLIINKLGTTGFTNNNQ